MGNSKSLIKNEQILNIIESNLVIREKEKKQFGEVFTPIKYVLETIHKLPKKNWENPYFKWLDPACGIGNFPVIVYYKLMNGLKKIIKNPETRSKHIIENMLYMVELNKKNVDTCRKIFKLINKHAKPNIYNMNFFNFNPEFEFHIIMGNPPWNKARKQGEFGGGVLWDKFITRSFDILSKNGYLCFMTPSGWRSPGKYNKLWKFMCNKQIIYIHIFSKQQAKNIFNIMSRFDIYIIRNKENKKKTQIVDENNIKHAINLKKWPFLPNSAYKEIKPILTSYTKGINVIYDNYYHSQNKLTQSKKDHIFRHPIIHSIKKSGFRLIYSSSKKSHFGISKVILSKNEKQYDFKEQIDFTGKYGLSEVAFGIPIKSKKEGELLLKAINTEKFKKILAACKWSLFQTPPHMFCYFKKDFYKYFM